MRKLPAPASLFLAVCVLLSPLAAAAQQPQSASLGELRDQIAKFEKIEHDPGATADVKNINRDFLESRRAELRSLLSRRRDALSAYLSASRALLRTDEIEKVEESIRSLEAELRSLSPGETPESARVLPAVFTPREPATLATRGRGDAVASSLARRAAPRAPCPANPNDLISSVLLVTGGVNSAGVAQDTLEVTLSVPLSATNQPPDVIVVGVGSVQNLQIPATHIKATAQAGSTSTVLTPTSPITTLSGTGRDTLLIALQSPVPPSATKVTVTLSDLAFECPSAASPTLIGAASITGNVTPNNTLLASDIEALNEANKAAAAKRSGDKNFRMGFTTVKADSGDAEGAADISFIRKFPNSQQGTGSLFNFFDQADISFDLKKSSAEQADPRHLTLGFNLRKSFLVFSRLRVPSPGAGALTLSEAQNRVRNKGFFRVLLIKQGFNLEGEAFDFKTTNFVSDTHFELASIAKKLGPGFYNLNVFAGPEIGRNLAKPDAAAATGATEAQLAAADWITRLKAGGEFTLRLLPAASGDNWGVELNLGYVNRHLFSSEVFTQESTKDGETTKKLVTVGKGNRAWRQADLKLFLFGNQSARYGVQLSYQNGQLPPAFTPTKGFKFGLVIESSDDRQSGEAANQQ